MATYEGKPGRPAKPAGTPTNAFTAPEVAQRCRPVPRRDLAQPGRVRCRTDRVAGVDDEVGEARAVVQRQVPGGVAGHHEPMGPPGGQYGGATGAGPVLPAVHHHPQLPLEHHEGLAGNPVDVHRAGMSTTASGLDDRELTASVVPGDAQVVKLAEERNGLLGLRSGDRRCRDPRGVRGCHTDTVTQPTYTCQKRSYPNP